MTKRDNIIKWSIVSIFVLLYSMVSVISTIHVIDFFKLSNPDWLAITLAIAFEVGAAACLGAIIILDKTSKALVWMLFVLITVMQMMGNMYYAYSHIQNFQGWIELFGLNEEEPIFQKRILSIVSGAILPIVALGFIKSLVDYIRPGAEVPVSSFPNSVNDQITDSVTQVIEDVEPMINPEAVENGVYETSKIVNEYRETEEKKVWDKVRELREEGKLPELTQEEIEEEPTALANSEYRQPVDEIVEYHENSENKPHKEIEKKLAMAIANDPELKDKLNEAIKKLDKGDKYTKNEDSNTVIDEPIQERRVFGGM